jgi:hypothetical protein
MSQELEFEQKSNYRKNVTEFENLLSGIDGCLKGEEKDKMNPLKHIFADGLYVREVFMPADQLLVTKIHKVEHPAFVLKGKVSVLTESGVEIIEGPCYFITKPGTKRVIYTHEDTTWVTVHSTDKKTPEEVEEEVIAKNFDDPVISIKEVNLLKNIEQ